MTNYIEQRLDISDNQKEKIKLAMKNKEAVTIQVKGVGDDLIAFSCNGQIDNINKAFGKYESVKITLSKAQLKHNKNKVSGGFLGALLKLAAPILAEEVLPKVVDKVLGHGIFSRAPSGGMYKIKSFGRGLYLSNKSNTPYNLLIIHHIIIINGEGIFIRNPKGDDWIEGEGIIHEIAKDMPLLNLIF